jgi:tetratricopeptide (TPR) repeat protein
MMNRALELEPLSIVVNSCLGQIFYEAKRYDESISQLKKAIEMDSNYQHPYGWLGLAYLHKEMYDDAIEMLNIGAQSPGYGTRCIGLLGYTYAVQGKRDAALQQLKYLNELSNEKVVDPCFIAWIYMGLGEKDKAYEWLEKAYEVRSNWLIMLNNDQLFEPLHSDARYKTMLRKIGFDI